MGMAPDAPRRLLPVLLSAVAMATLLFPCCSCYESYGVDELLRKLKQDINEIQEQLDNAFREFDDDLNSEVEVWMDSTDKEMGQRLREFAYVNWNYLTDLTDDNSRKLELASEQLENWYLNQTKTAKYYLSRSDEIRNQTTVRMLRLMTHFNSVPLAEDPNVRKQLNRLSNKMQGIYSTTNVTRNGKTYRLSPELTDIMANSRDYDELLWAWSAWHNATGRKLKPFYPTFVRKMNMAARDNGFPDIGVYWQVMDYDQQDVEEMMDDLFEQLFPFYEQLHAYVRRKLSEIYKGYVDTSRPIPAHLLGNMWAQEWSELADVLLPFPNVSAYDVTKAMVDQAYTAPRMFRLAEEFFTSIGLEPMTQDFWNNSLITRPDDGRDVDCHGSAEDFMSQTDFRIKMCTEITETDLQTVHHEMGHIEYFMLYRHQPTIFRAGANAAFHEAIGDTIALSAMTDAHLTTVGLIPSAGTKTTERQSYEQDINFLMRTALLKIAFLPFGYVIDKWRYKVFRGEITPDRYTSSWWKMRKYYQGIAPAIRRSNEEFDPGAKFHIPANVPYSRYFFSFIAQFQFQSTLCQLSGHQGPLYKCDIYRSKAAGRRLRSVLSLGASRPWPEAMEVFTGQKKFSVDSILEFFSPLIDWLERENEGKQVGWS